MFFGFIALVISIIVAIKLSRLSREVRALKEAKTGGVSISRSLEQPSPVTVVAPVVTMPTPVPVQQGAAVSSEPDTIERFFHWLTENWLLKVGVILILIGFGWFISYAFVHNWIGPVGRVLFGFILGGGLAAFGTFRMPNNQVQGTTFLILGSALAVITSFAAQVVYSFFPPAIALAIPALVAVYVTFVALTYNRQDIAVYAVCIGLIAPLLTNSSEANYTFLFAYLSVISVGSVWIAVVKNWRAITALSLFGILFYALGYLGTGYGIGLEAHLVVVFMLYALAALYFVVSLWSIVQSNKDVSMADSLVAILTSILIIMVTFVKVPEELVSIVLALWLIPFGFGGFYVFIKTHKERFFYLYGIVALIFLAIITAAELSGPALVFAYAFESVAISLVSYIVTNRLKIGYTTSITMFVPALLALGSFASPAWNRGVLHVDFFVIAVVTILFFVLGIFYYLMAQQNEAEQKELPRFYKLYITIGSFFAFSLIWTTLHAALDNNGLAVFAALTIYTIIGLITYFKGIFTENTGLRYYGAVVLLLVILRLLLIDVWALPLALRIVTFILVGVLFISTAFIKRQHNS